MTLQTFSNVMIPTYPGGVYAMASTQLIDAAGEKSAFILRAPKAGNIHKIHFRLGTVTTGQTLKGSLQDVDATTGFPDEIIDQSGTVAVADTDDGTWKTIILGADRAVALAEIFAFVLEFDAAVGNLVISLGSDGSGYLECQGTYPALKAGAGPTWAKSLKSPIVVLEYSDGSIAEQDGTIGVPTTVSFNSGSNPAERGNQISIPYPIVVRGLYLQSPIAADVDLILYDSDGTTILGTVSIDKDTLSGTGYRPIHTTFATPVNLLANTTYYICVKPTTVTNIALSLQDFSVAAHMASISCGTACYGVNRAVAGTGAFTSETTRRYSCGLVANGFSDGVGSGGLKLVGRGGLAG